MIRKEIIDYSLRNLYKRKARSFLTIASIFVGVASIFIFISFGLGLYKYVNEFSTSTSADKISVMPRGIGAPGLDVTFSLSEDDLRTVERTRGVREATGAYIKVAEIKQKNIIKYVFITSYDPEMPLLKEIGNFDIQEGRDIQKGDDGKVVLGFNYMLDNKIFPDKYKVGDNIEIQGKKHRIIGFFEQVGNPQDDSNICVTNEYFKKLYPNTTGYSWIIVRSDINDIPSTVERIRKELRDSRNVEIGKEDFTVESFQDLLEQYTNVLNIIIGFVLLIALISIIVSAINTANTMFTSVLERTREIGTMKAVGAKNSEVLKIFIFEAGFLGLIAGIIGATLGFTISYSAGLILKNLGWGFLSPAFPWYLFLGVIAFATLTGAISGIWPAWRASKLKAVDALRYE